ncbi:MAG: metal-sulfur cluster assembly factor, partial [Flavitalea sp.]
MVNAGTISVEDVKGILSRVMDPEVPVLSILDLGIVRDIQIEHEVCESAGATSIETHRKSSGETPGKIIITITPTYSGCPAMDV